MATKTKAMPTGDDDGPEYELKFVSLLDSPHLDANVSRRQSFRERRVPPVPSPLAATSGPKFTRSWSFVEPADKRKFALKDVRRSSNLRNTDLRVNVTQALARTWEFTNTARSPAPNSSYKNINDFVAIDADIQKQLEVESEVENVSTPSSMTSIGEDEEEVEVPRKKELKIKPRVRTVVVPSAAATEEHWLPLSNLDRVVNPTFSSVVHYYRGVINERRSLSDVTKDLKESLGKTLVDFYPLAGRLELDADGKVDLHCNNAGAVWIEAEADSDVDGAGGLQPNHLLSGFDTARLGPGPLWIPDQISPMPVLVIQVTTFTCGTIAIATSWHHTVADGFSGIHFLKSWAEVAQGKPISSKPLHSRELLKPRHPPNPTLVNGYSTEELDDIAAGEQEVSTSEPAQLETFDLNKEAIAQLKIKANVEPPPFTPRPYTSAESISAHLWRQMTKARTAANCYEAGREQTKFFMFVDGRKRLRLPPGYFGNVVCSACAVARESDILRNPLHYAASLIRVATRNVTEEYFRSLIDWVAIQGMSNSKSEHVNSIGHDVAATFWTFFPLYEIEFGWGRPVFAARNSPPRPRIDGIAMMPNQEGEGMVALLNLHSDRMSKLQKQISFSTVFH